MFEIAPYDPRWPEAFAAEANRLRAALGSLALRIDHVGSTAVPGLSAKPVIDIHVSVATLASLSPYKERLQALGYVHVPDPDDAFCPFFHRPQTWPHTHHVHLVVRGGAEEQRVLAFRDYLRDHADVAGDYETLKTELARRLTPVDRESRETYARAKSSFVERVVAVALRNGYPREEPDAPRGQDA